MKYESIKAKAKLIFAGGVADWPQLGASLAKGSSPAFQALLPFVLATKGEREEMRAFAEAFEAKRGDWVAGAAKSVNSPRIDVAWRQTVLRAREAGLQLIDNWDVRQVGKLIELFPDCVPAKYRGKQLTCYMADNEESDWMVEIDGSDSQRGLDSLRPTMRM